MPVVDSPSVSGISSTPTRTAIWLWLGSRLDPAFAVGRALGATDGDASVGATEGRSMGNPVGAAVGTTLGATVGTSVGIVGTAQVEYGT